MTTASPFSPADRLKRLPPYIFVELDRAKERLLAQKKDVINVGIGDPDLPPPAIAVEALKRALSLPRVHRYPNDRGCPEFREAAAAWHKRRFGVELDPLREVRALIGTKEGIGHLPLTIVNPGDTVLIPDPGYPPYFSGTIFADGKAQFMPLREKNGFLPDLDAIGAKKGERIRLMFINYPNNPTAAVCDLKFLEKVVAFAHKHGVIVAHDLSYSEIYFDTPSPSILQVPGARDVAVEFHSFSKMFSMPGWRLGWVAGNADVLAALGGLKANLDSGAFTAVQLAGAELLLNGWEAQKEIRQGYQKRLDILVDTANSHGWKIKRPAATLYAWLPVPKGFTSTSFAMELIEKEHVIVLPGNAMGKEGEGYFRISAAIEDSRIKEAAERLCRFVRGNLSE
ncbi:MAG: aminotransferase class I/II-fold pyridoxal phosphate-dependent enzyme [Planctomycetota bacterium]|nr:aminotransferase class I/II-fold pyridoxal phosphate-dependent enzyme [Planctomycetota bacterium]